jgi:hypothetical protein
MSALQSHMLTCVYKISGYVILSNDYKVQVEHKNDLCSQRVCHLLYILYMPPEVHIFSRRINLKRRM